MPEYIKVCEDAARQGGKVLLDWQGRINPKEKAPKDLVSEADFASQQTIRDIVKENFPDHDFLGEEDAPKRTDARSSDFRWIVDPLDGTVNYVHQVPTFSVSVALEQDGELLAGVVYDPTMNECFTAERGGGAYLNGSPIRVSQCQLLEQALVATGFAAGVSRDSEELKSFIDVLAESRALRRIGSAALNLAYLAAGRFDAYWATRVKIWDVAAGVLLLKEAGGTLNGLDGSDFDLARPKLAASATPKLQQQLLATLNRGDSAQLGSDAKT